MRNRLVPELTLAAALSGLILTMLPSSVPAWASSPHRRVVAARPPTPFFPRIAHRPAPGRGALNSLSVSSANDPVATASPGASRTAPLQPRASQANPVVPATWTALGANPVTSEVSLCSQPPALALCGSYGPSAGRVTSLVVDPTNASTVYAGSAGGGVWKSTNAGASWSPLTDTQASLAIGALAIDPTGKVIYAGTGEDNLSDSQIGQGVLISLDGGTSWTLSGQATFTGHYIGGIAIDRMNASHAFVASDLGLFETKDGGASWPSVVSYIGKIYIFPGFPAPSGAVHQVIQDPSNPHAYWLSVSDDCHTEGGDVLLSTDDGTSWSNVTPVPLGAQLASRIGVGVGAGGVAYLSAAGCYGNLIELDATGSSGTGWAQLYGATEYSPSTPAAYHVNVSRPGLFNYFNLSGGNFGQGSYDDVVAVDPVDPNHAIFGGVTVLTTTNRAASFTDVGREYTPNAGLIHPDFHAFAFWSHDHLFAGNDGGVYKTNDFGGVGAGGDWTNVSAGMDTIQYYGGAALDPSHLLGGAQDNGSSGNFPNAGLGSLPTAGEYLDGDGTFTAIDPNSTAVWASYPGLGIFKGDSSAPFSSFNLAAPCSTGSEPACGDPVEFVAPFLLDATSGQKLIAGTNKVYYSTSGGQPGTWSALSNSLGNPAYPTDRLQTMAMTPSGGVTGEIMTASRYGKAYVSTQASGMLPNSGTWLDVTNAGQVGGLPAFPGYVSCASSSGCPPMAVEPNGWFTGIAINPLNPNEAWVTVGGLHIAHVWHTVHLHDSMPIGWMSIDGTAPSNVADVPADAIAFDAGANKLYLGTETGILVCAACSGATPAPAWSILGNLPNVKVNALTFTRNMEPVAWTHGRGAWALLGTSPALFVSPTTVNLTCIRGAATPPPQAATLTNKGGGTLTWTVTPSSGITATPPSGSIAAGASTPINVTPSPCPLTSGLDPNVHSLTFASNGGSPVVPVTIAVTYRGQYTPLSPVRILDTRLPGPLHGPLGPGGTLILQVAGAGGVPKMTDPTPPSAAVINVTVTDTVVNAGGSFLTVYPSDAPRPNASNLNWGPGMTVANLVEVALDALTGTVTIYNAAGTVDVVADVQGWVSTPGTVLAIPNGGLYNPLVPGRIFDTRTGPGGHIGPMGPGEVFQLQVSGALMSTGQTVPSGASAVVLNLTATNSTAPTDFLTMYPADVSRPIFASNLNFAANQTRANRVIVRLSPGGAVDIFNAVGTVNVVVDVSGWFTDGVNQLTGAQFTGIRPARILDTRDGTGGYRGAMTAGRTLSVVVAGRGGVPAMDSPAAPTAVVMNVTATDTSDGSFFTVYPSDAQRPINSDLNWAAAGTVPNLVVVKLSPDGRVNVYNPVGSVDAIADVVGWY